MKNIIIASDHAGYDLKQHLVPYMEKRGFTVIDLGTNAPDSVDYPDFGKRAATAILDNVAPWGIVICGSGVGISIAANRFKGIRAALCMTPEMARLAKLHGNCNILALAGRLITPLEAEKIVESFAETAFEGGRHLRRIDKMDDPTFC